MSVTGKQITGTGSPIQVEPLLNRNGRQFDFFANTANAGNIYLGPSTVQTDGTDAWVMLPPGRAWTMNAFAGVQQVLGTNLYMVAGSGDMLHIAVSY